MNAPHVLVVEDEQRLARLLVSYLQAAGYRASAQHDGLSVQATVAAGDVDLILLDWMLPGMDGLSLCRALRANSDIPIIMMTARAQEEDRLDGLDSGADDYICKPFSPREVVARVRAVLRRRPAGTPTPGLQIDDQGMRAFVHGTELALTPVEFRLLKRLRDAPGKALSRDDLRTWVYEDRRIVHDRTIDTHVKNLRRKLEEAGLAEAISAVYGVGYRWEARSAQQP
ncbi:response regulator [Pseudoduganella sp. FT25W]|jgi:two-component system response regulator BaeR|uniref:Response regulator n=1 Tax=Duganella alba TaxID=2666081 RepID=A0A6L5QAM6_9BURK|nr:response regulator [Duganella alba]MRX06854.1 response regulator [Duganella alba]MRX16249.1 response regulator [Duganella alba]